MAPDGATERAIDRAMAGVKELLASELRGIREQLGALNRRLDETERLRDRVEAHDTSITALQAMSQSQGYEIREIKQTVAERQKEQRQDRRDRFGHYIGALGIVVAIVAVVANQF